MGAGIKSCEDAGLHKFAMQVVVESKCEVQQFHADVNVRRENKPTSIGVQSGHTRAMVAAMYYGPAGYSL